ncbi:MAG: hypothetical protein ACK2U4_21010 [Candidatus Promineifilaceae bacterium]
MDEIVPTLSMCPATYEITVPGHLDPDWVELDDVRGSDGVTLAAGYLSNGRPVTILTGTIDQAALHGLLRRLYSLGLPLISVKLIEE